MFFYKTNPPHERFVERMGNSKGAVVERDDCPAHLEHFSTHQGVVQYLRMWPFGAAEARVSTDEKKIDELLSRGVENVIPRDLAAGKLKSGQQLRIYLGIDPTGAKLHLGHSVPLRKLKAFGDMGHHIIFLVGSFTAMIGDPSGRDAVREPLTREQVRANFKTYKHQAQKILDFSKIEVRYNDEWLAPLTLSDTVKLAGKFTVQQLLQRDMFQERIKEGKPIALHEFLYPLMVGYDSVVLDVDCELGGSDQEFNILAGRHLQQALGKRDKFVLTTKLIEGTDGRKMSKTYGNCIYVEDTPQEMYGKLMSVRDELVKIYFEACTEVPLSKVAEIMKQHPKDAKSQLAKEIVSLYHGVAAAKKAAEGFMKPDDAPEVVVARGTKLRDIINTLNVSTSELRRLVDAGAIEIAGGEKLLSIDAKLKNSTLKIGKHRFLKIIIK